MSDIKDGGPAYPINAYESRDRCIYLGMTLRDYMAIHAPSMCDDPQATMTEICRYRYIWADAMLEAREVKP